MPLNASDYIARTKDFFSEYWTGLPENPTHLAVIVETREFPNFGQIVKNHLYFLPRTFGLLVVCCKGNEEFVDKELGDIDGYSTMTLPSSKMDSMTYNKLLTSSNFWSVIDAEKVLIFQTDSLLLRPGIERYLKYNFVGAPWKHIRMTGGNGGLSIRDVAEMKRVCSSFKWDVNKHGNEDLFFCREVRNVAPNDVAQSFSVETIFYPKPIGIHACDSYIDESLRTILYENALKELGL